ncbi:hypothetical protein NIES37_50760 [Tolypothrix tenuis PCC 7101]|uniref:Uncharacterized protein n=1 Tax=Tolypothrix tenuis PCC 7101 TaxID=231146 RepID=A0A1Z4N5T3_9CYAN|nr:hypothetical protein [Aulosira sp. FACHB-113]BAZ01078.1 hypothetical protein NIES37_50760 [Tolypothrix tenuis PCC 7101]BAZ75000.1 hypothetical protein NIES50_35800 [Aulosira laxa NIES-50]
MASIKISELRPAGSELFQDSESFLNDLNSQEMEIIGGRILFISRAGSVAISISAQTVVGNTVNANTFGNLNTVAV